MATAVDEDGIVYLSDPATPSVESAIEFSPVDDVLWEKMSDLPPMLLIAGARDPLFNAKKWNAQVSKHPESNDHLTLRLLEGEGHDLRGRNALNLRMEAALDFLATLHVPENKPSTRSP
ncbi:MAG: hypothetical protein AB8G23_21860 [Myxococcota bacterium]